MTFRTDLAMEAFGDGGADGLPGVNVNAWEESGIALTEVIITDSDAGAQLGKPCGRYLTLEAPGLRRRDPDARLALSALLAEELGRMLPEDARQRCVLVAGLGNRAITPDALGPDVVERTLVTRHLQGDLLPLSDLRCVSAIAPGVLGVTGIETMELVESAARLVEPAAVICVDSLAARDSARIGTTIQLSDAGIQPGGGVGNHRRALTRENLGTPVIAVGMPTVIYAATLARDAFEWLNRREGDGQDHDAGLKALERALLGAEIGEMIVTPREIDALVLDAAEVIASGINRALQPDLSHQEIAALLD